MGRLQARFESNCRDLLADAAQLRRAGNRTDLEHLAASFMQHNVECFDEVCEKLCPGGARPVERPAVASGAPRAQEEVLLPSF
jgi:hypothetical protein